MGSGAMGPYRNSLLSYFTKETGGEISKFSFMGLDFWAMDSAKEGDILLPFVGPNIASHNTDK